LSSVIFISTIILGCNKDKPSGPDKEVSSFRKVISVTNNYGNNTTYLYESDGNLSKQIENKGIGFGNTYSNTSTFTYSKDTIKVVIVNSGNVDSNTPGNTTVQLRIINAQGYITKTAFIENGALNHIYYYEYDNDGYCTKMTYGSEISTYIYSGGNLISSIYTVGTDVYKYTYEYYDKENSLSQDHFGMKFWGKDNRNLLKTVIYNTKFAVLKYYYEFDQYAYVSKRIASGDISSWETYIYK